MKKRTYTLFLLIMMALLLATPLLRVLAGTRRSAQNQSRSLPSAAEPAANTLTEA
jgi:hypothetical protein